MNKTVLFLIAVLVFCSVNSSKMKGKKLVSKLFLEAVVNTTTSQVFCFLNSNGTVYDLNKIHSDTDYSISGIDYRVNFNVCKNPISQCPNSTTSMVTFLGPNNQCVRLAGPDRVVSDWSILTDSDVNMTQIQLKLPPGDRCLSDASKNYTTLFSIDCDQSINGTQVLTPNLDINSCTNTIRLKSQYACPTFSVYSFWTQIVSNKWIVGGLLIGFGIFFCFLGTWFITATQVIAGVLGTWFVLCFLLFYWLQVSISSAAFWIIIVVTFLVGLLAGYLLTKVGKFVSAMVLGGFLGYLLTNFLYQLFLYKITSNPMVVYWIAAILLVAGGAVAGYFLTEHLFIIATAFIGGYSLIRGISFMAGHFPDERQVIDLISKGETSQLSQLLTWHVYAYLVSMLICAIAGAVVQYYFFYENEDDRKAREDKENSKNLNNPSNALLNPQKY